MQEFQFVSQINIIIVSTLNSLNGLGPLIVLNVSSYCIGQAASNSEASGLLDHFVPQTIEVQTIKGLHITTFKTINCQDCKSLRILEQ